MRKITIGYEGSRAFLKKRTGTENYSYQLLKNLAKIDRKNQYIVYIRPKSIYDATAQVIERFPSNFIFTVINWPRLWTQGGLGMQTFKDRLDVLFVPSHTLPIIRRAGLKTIVTVHDLGSEYLPSMHQLKQRAYLSLMQKYQLKTATKIIAVSKATKEDLVKKIGLKSGKIEVVYEGYDKDKFKIQKSNIKNDRLIYSLIPYFLFVGTVQPRKNLERVIRAFATFLSFRGAKRRGNLNLIKIATDPSDPRNDNLNLVIAGSKGWQSDEIYKLPERLGIEKWVKFLGYVPDEKLPVLYSNAQALVFPSLFEGFGLPILEAQACRCPVITSNLSSMPEVAGKGTILVDPYSVDEIARAMIRVKGERERGKLIKAGFENIKRFSWEKCAAQTLEVFEEILSTKS